MSEEFKDQRTEFKPGEQPKMPAQSREQALALLKDMVRRIEEGREDSMNFAVALRRPDVHPTSTVCMVWGPFQRVADMVAQLSEPVVTRLLGKRADAGGFSVPQTPIHKSQLN